MSRLHHDLLAVLDAVQVESSTRIRLLGEPHEVSDETTNKRSDDDESADLASVLGGHIYVKLYIVPGSPDPLVPAEILDPSDFVAALAAANTGRGTWEPGWVVQRIEPDGQVVALKDDLAFWVRPSGLCAWGDAIRPGESCRVWVPSELRGARSASTSPWATSQRRSTAQTPWRSHASDTTGTSGAVPPSSSWRRQRLC